MSLKYLNQYFSFLILITSTSFACLWDRDTLWMEDQKFPEALELISGKFQRHSPVYYPWRGREVVKQLKEDPKNLALFDDLSVAHEKLGNHDKAIAVAKTALKLDPERYESHANIGTFYIHKGEYKKGLKHLKKAIKINPNAHFGREKYQIFLVEYIVSKMDKDSKLTYPLSRKSADPISSEKLDENFSDFLAKKIKKEELSLKDRQEAVKGILGMMFFGNHNSVILLEALGDLTHETLYREEFHGGQQIGARAYLKASYLVEDKDMAAAYRQKAKDCLRLQVINNISNSKNDSKLAYIEKRLKKEIAKGEDWYKLIEQKEKYWAEKGLDLDEKYQESYGNKPELYKSKK